jgi:hypothetical protein
MEGVEAGIRFIMDVNRSYQSSRDERGPATYYAGLCFQITKTLESWKAKGRA